MPVYRHSTFSCFLDRYERCCDVLQWDEGLDEWGRLRQDGSIVCLSGDGIVVVLDLPISTLKGRRPNLARRLGHGNL